MPLARRCLVGIAVTTLVLVGPACSSKTKNDVRNTGTDLNSDAKSNGSKLSSDASSFGNSVSSDLSSDKSSK
jgi:hypothetical protein